MPARKQICFGYMPKTNQIVGKTYQTSLDSRIEDLKPSLACPTPTTNENQIWKFDLDRRQKVKGQHKGKKTLLSCILTLQMKEFIYEVSILIFYTFELNTDFANIKKNCNMNEFICEVSIHWRQWKSFSFLYHNIWKKIVQERFRGFRVLCQL